MDAACADRSTSGRGRHEMHLQTIDALEKFDAGFDLECAIGEVMLESQILLFA
jgi:hypothetical protein